MPSTIVQVGLAFLVGVGLLGSYYDRRAAVFLLVAVLLPDADTLVGFVMNGAHRTLLHNVLVPVGGMGLLYWETHAREASWIRHRVGDYGTRLLWVGAFVHVFAHISLDWTHLEGVNMLWPLRDQFFKLDGEAYYSTAEGFVQTFVEVFEDPDTGQQSVDVGGGGGRQETHVSNPAQPSANPSSDGPVDRRVPIAVQGWQLYLIVAGLFVAVAKRFQSPGVSESNDE
ncbi:metal-dependent hydrolase [Natronomonas amylolytica]|uniref:metal-dependent hydrolase n=1 Tax=Natronomonas amylolytica TaxID=3108498 RepID=UPI00300BD902